MNQYIIQITKNTENAAIVSIGAKLSKGRGVGICRRKFACKGKELEKRLNELAGRYVVVEEFENDLQAKKYVSKLNAEMHCIR